MENRDKVEIISGKVYRIPGFYTKRVHHFLIFLQKQGFSQSPVPKGFSKDAREVLSFVPGKTYETLATEGASSLVPLVSAAKLLRSFHDVSQGYLLIEQEDSSRWMFDSKEPQEVICHNDFAPYNICFEDQVAIGLIDFDTAIPGPRNWDIVYALYRFSPFYSQGDVESFGSIDDKIERAKLFCDSYKLPDNSRVGLVDLMIERLETLLIYLLDSASEGNEECKNNINEGHHKKYLSDINYIKQHKVKIEKGLISC